MSDRPLVSVLVPFFEPDDRFALAIASLLEQDMPDWECILVDDGSSTSPGWLATLDRRFRLIRHAENRGRGAARATALAAARGLFVAMLDADDWIYPEKLREQAAILRASPTCVGVSSPFAIADASGRLWGVRGGPSLRHASIEPPLHSGASPNVPFAAAMWVGAIAKRVGFDERRRSSEDNLFLRGILSLGPLRWDLTPHYVYTELDSVDRDKLLAGAEAGLRTSLQLNTSRFARYVAATRATTKWLGYRIAPERAVDWYLRRRVTLASADLRLRHSRAHAAAVETARRLCGNEFDLSPVAFGSVKPQSRL